MADLGAAPKDVNLCFDIDELKQLQRLHVLKQRNDAKNKKAEEKMAKK